MKATYRGKEKSDAAKLNTANIKRFGIMMRRSVLRVLKYHTHVADKCLSFFGEQEGPFSLQIESITAIKVKTNEAVVDQYGGNGIRAHISTATKEDKWVADSMRSPAQPRSVDEVSQNISHHTLTRHLTGLDSNISNNFRALHTQDCFAHSFGILGGYCFVRPLTGGSGDRMGDNSLMRAKTFTLGRLQWGAI
jgi:hypothetical protein